MAQEAKEDLVVVEKKDLTHVLKELGHILNDLEDIMDIEFEEKARARFDEIKSGKAKGHSENELLDYLKKEGIDAQ